VREPDHRGRRRTVMAVLALAAAGELVAGLAGIGVGVGGGGSVRGGAHRASGPLPGSAPGGGSAQRRATANGRSGAGGRTPIPASNQSTDRPTGSSSQGPAGSAPGRAALETFSPPGSSSPAARSSPGPAPAPPAPASPAPSPAGPPGPTPPGPAPTGTTPPGPPGPAGPPAVACQTDLALADSPDAGYNFLCFVGRTPLTWASSNLILYVNGLSPAQQAALQVALVQWESDAHFNVAFTSDPRSAGVVIDAAPLGSAQPGYTEDGYTTVSYRCDPQCAFDHADIVLSSTASLTSTNWVSTILHELGHVAGLNHVSRPSEVMYPYLTMSSPVMYESGDQAGLAVLAAERGA
jgi:hypothetical protein